MQRINIIRHYCLALICMAVLTVSGCEKKTALIMTDVPADAEAVTDAAPARSAEYYVHVCGAVVTEGVYVLPADARIIDAVAAAGGFRDDADKNAVNLASEITDGMRIKIPTVTESEEAQSTENTKINLNTATEAELCTLSGIGPSRAADIIRYRETHGAFSRIEDIMNVTGIKDKLFEKIRDLITV